MKNFFLMSMALLSCWGISSQEYHVSVNGDDNNPGSESRPFRTITAAADLARAGSIITVHEGIYRERIDPPRGGTSDENRIIYRSSPGEKVVIKGSEIVKGWEQIGKGIWRVSISNDLFGAYNPYSDVIGTDWYNDLGRDHHTGEIYLNNKSFYEVASLTEVESPSILNASNTVFNRKNIQTTDPDGSSYKWYAEVNKDSTILYANFHEFDPNRELVEINVRNSCFYPSKPHMNYITVRGFHMSQAACQWSTATDEQDGVIGTHWSKGWIIEENEISNSKNIGIALGKDRKSGHRAWAKANMNGESKSGEMVYNEVILRALLESDWNKDSIGSHIVRNNTIHDCEKNGIHGSLGGVFSRIENNHIYDIYRKRQYYGADIAGIKLLGSIDVLIKGNRIHDSFMGIWMDWMAQGTRVSGNLLYRNDNSDLFFEMDHGPYVVDNNIFLSESPSRWGWSQGGAYINNLFAYSDNIGRRSNDDRVTPYHKPHSTMIAGYSEILEGDDRFFNNVFVNSGLDSIVDTRLPMHLGGNVYMNQAQPYSKEKDFIKNTGFDPKIKIEENNQNVYLNMNWPSSMDFKTKIISTDDLGRARIPDLPFEDTDGSFLIFSKDYFGDNRSPHNPTPGPIEKLEKGRGNYKVW
ncbi:DUF1565 domain-containing protein [Flavobacteriaceae bacterium F89]|uniref:DUF1565 domain-containing protein n=1 Tax=Cerina litoralis TaxID=2874477 RepID=A0AAE3EXM2_9FLAO|nr:right-handed parallel beta-helix repeat-containing protein [Cerina litoralis]MCG2462229.1 DUF1565 domain-containing protein [Cerina litoralis]